MLVTPPKIVGSAAIADILGRARWTVRQGIVHGRRPYTVGYIGKIGGRHCWDLYQFLDGAVDTSCRVCDEPAGIVGLCPTHAQMFVRSWDRSERSRVALLQFVALCRWVVERHAHLGEIQCDDVWSTVCVTPDCNGIANIAGRGPLCPRCLDEVCRRLVVV